MTDTYLIKRSGQPRPYADSEKIVEVYLSEGLTREQAADRIKLMNIGFDDTKGQEWYMPRLSYLVENTPGVWEFKMVTAYTG